MSSKSIFIYIYIKRRNELFFKTNKEKDFEGLEKKRDFEGLEKKSNQHTISNVKN